MTTFVEHRRSDDEALRDALVASGCSRGQAASMAVFMPIAFARVLLSGLGISPGDTYVLRTPSGRQLPRRFVNNPVFRAATSVARSGIGGDALLAVAGRSAEFQAVNQLLLNGSHPGDLRISEPVLFSTDEEPDEETFGPAPPASDQPNIPQGPTGLLGRSRRRH